MRKRTLAVMVVATFAGGVLLSGPAQAAVQYLVIGALTETTKTTSLKNTAGIPLSLYAAEGFAPLKVNQSVVVTNLNADKLDGLSSGSFARASMKTGVIQSGSARLDTDLNMYVATATCPEGTLRTGGGSYISSSTVYASAPEADGRGWTVIGLYDARAYAICLSPNGSAIPGAISMATAPDVVTTFKRFASGHTAP